MELYVFVLFCLTSALAAPSPTKIKQTFLGKPTGHCDPVCSCQMNGHYYSEGERWSIPGDPCTLYQCFQNGYFEEVSTGCLYKEECKALDSTWFDGCSTFSCIMKDFKVQYQLVEAGCSREGGHCLPVGHRVQEGCDVLECQLKGNCLAVEKVSTGCSVEGGCKPVNSFWHDGCTVYTCAMDANRAVEMPLGNEMMHWPDGSFALLKPQSGCPTDVPGQWEEGYRKHYGEGENYFSSSLSLAGEYNLDFMSHHFCVHVNRPITVPLVQYQTHWEPGKYCILRSQGRCPRGFNEGFIMFDDSNKKGKLSEASGTLPDGDFTTDTTLVFCCRDDGPVIDEIVLPKGKNFVMFMGHRETQCQTVKGMTSSVEYFTFDGSPASAFVQNGSLPEIKYSNGDVTLYTCLYQPMGCGCADVDGHFVMVGTERTIKCITKKCVSDRGFNILQIISEGCSVEGRCEPENAIWSTVGAGLCTKQTCERVLNKNVETLEVKTLSEGCEDGSVCRDLGYERYQGCYTSVCTKDKKTKKPEFKVRKADCPWLDTCKPVNSTWTHACMTYRCDMGIQGGHYQWKIQPIEYGCNDGTQCYKVGDVVQGKCYQAECKLNANKTVVYLDVVRGGCTWKEECKKVNETWKDGCHHFQCVWSNTDTGFVAVINATNVSCEWNNTCYQDNETWTDGCVGYKCVVSRQEAEVKWGVETIRLGCRDFQNKCLGVGENITEGCITYQCNHQGDRIGLDAVQAGCTCTRFTCRFFRTGCEWNTLCKPENTIWTDDEKCVDYKCLKNNHKDGSVMQIKVVDYGCVFNKTCKPVNSTWQDGCRKRQCVVRKTGKIIQRDTAPVSAGCDDEGVCRPVAYKKVTPTCLSYECRFNKEFKDSFFTLAGGACRARNGTCFNAGKTWVEKEAGICVTYKCARDKDVYRSAIVEQSCRDVNGVCKPIGSTGFSAEVRAQLRSNCTCTQAENKVIGVNISCAK